MLCNHIPRGGCRPGPQVPRRCAHVFRGGRGLLIQGRRCCYGGGIPFWLPDSARGTHSGSLVTSFCPAGCLCALRRAACAALPSVRRLKEGCPRKSNWACLRATRRPSGACQCLPGSARAGRSQASTHPPPPVGLTPSACAPTRPPAAFAVGRNFSGFGYELTTSEGHPAFDGGWAPGMTPRWSDGAPRMP